MSFEDTHSRKRAVLIVGIVGAAAAALLGMFAPHDGAVWRASQVLKERVQTALMAAGHSGVEVGMSGQRAILRGIVEQETDIAEAERAALTAAGPGGVWAGGVTSVDVSGLSVGEFSRPYTWTARRDGERIVLSGAVPSEAARARVLTATAAAFPAAERVDEMRVAGGAPSPTFAEIAAAALQHLSGLVGGEVRIVDNQIVFIGDGNQRVVDALQATFSEPPPPFRSRFAVTIDGLDLQHPELQGLNLIGGDAEVCERAFDRLMERNVINFEPGSATIALSSRGVLDSLATVALRCDRFAIEVAGHTDDQGGREMNMELSRQRADAVAEYLAVQGVARSRLTARGYGPDQPRESNMSVAGQAANRRIEFYVSG